MRKLLIIVEGSQKKGSHRLLTFVENVLLSNERTNRAVHRVNAIAPFIPARDKLHATFSEFGFYPTQDDPWLDLILSMRSWAERKDPLIVIHYACKIIQLYLRDLALHSKGSDAFSDFIILFAEPTVGKAQYLARELQDEYMLTFEVKKVRFVDESSCEQLPDYDLTLPLGRTQSLNEAVLIASLNEWGLI